MSTDAIFDIFRDEAREHLAALEKGFLDLEAAGSPDDRPSIINELFRHAHSLKGDARSVGLDAIAQPSQVLETTLASLRDDPQHVDPAVIDAALRQLDVAREAFEGWQGGPSEKSTVADAPSPPPSVPVAEKEEPTEEKPKRKSRTAGRAPKESFTVRVSSEHLDRMLTLAAELRISHRGAEDLEGRLTDLLEQLDQLPIADLRMPVEARNEVEGRQSAIKDLLDLQSSILDQVRYIESSVHQRHVHEELLLEALETDIRQARLLPLSLVTESLRRAVRELAQTLGKSIRFEAKVGTILLDKAVIEALRDPLLHMIRNAAGHGIEIAQERQQTGKPEKGLIRIEASRLGDLVRITVRDDGRGVDFEKIRKRLNQMAVMDAVELADLTDKELSRYLFEPGFTTKEVEDTVSGRGVGLDVVLEAVQRLHGNVEYVSEEATGTGESVGTMFAITVPVTVSTVRILTVSAGDQWYGIPSAVIVRTGQVRGSQLRELEGTTVLPLDGEPIRWVHLRDVLENGAGMLVSDRQLWRYLLLNVDGRHLAVAVDDLEDEAEVVLKPLGFPLRGMPGIVGATIRPDGSVQIVLDPAGLSAHKRRIWKPELQKSTTPGRILVVDDSPTTRAILRKVLTVAGYTVHTAIDGGDALNRLDTHQVDVVVSDVVMPRMDGFQLTHEVKAKHGLPVILVTSMESEEHRRRGMEVGADAYVIKSTFAGEGLLEIVKQFV